MNIDKHLILIKGEDKTESISRCTYANGKWHVVFAKDKTYSYNYNYNNVQWLKNPVSLDPATTVVYRSDQPLSGIKKILVFDDYIKICFVTGFKKVYRSHEITIEQSCLNNPDAHNSFEYLKQLADKVSVTTEEDIKFLSKQYEKITCVSPGSVLAKYLHPTALKKPQHDQMPIFPFGFNLSQKSAAEKALNGQISVIEGPPGTGKTQTILNIIANAIMNKKTVAVVSNNNAATANVLEKLQKYDRVMHQPLKMLIRNPEKLDEDECRFAMNILTHTDFVTFNKLDKMPVLVVEVDGYAFHAENPKQLERDKMKDTILQKYNIPILRIRTNESGEETRLRHKLSEILKQPMSDVINKERLA